MAFLDQDPTSFYDAISAVQPEYDLIVDDYTGPGKRNTDDPEQNYEIPDTNQQLEMIQNIREMSINSEIIGRRATLEDFEGGNAREMETLIMIRNTGSESNKNDKQNESTKTDSSVSSNMECSTPSKFLLDESYFELKPRNLDAINLSGSSSSGSNNCNSDHEKSITETNEKSSLSKVSKNLHKQKHNKNSTNADKQIENEKICTPKYLTPKELYLKKCNFKES